MSTLSYDATGAARQALEQHLPALLEDRIATRIFAKDHTLWGPDAEAEASRPAGLGRGGYRLRSRSWPASWHSAMR